MEYLSPYVGQYAYRARVKTFLARSKEDWLKTMKANHRKTTDKKLTESQIAAWANEFDVLRSALSELPEEYGKLEIVFEYVMPLQNLPAEKAYTKRADAILLSRTAVTVLEFKQRTEPTVYMRRQLRAYRRRIQKRHVVSAGMNKRAILVLTLADHPQNEHEYQLWTCSADRLAAVIQEAVDASKLPTALVKDWLCSPWRFEDGAVVAPGTEVQ